MNKVYAFILIGIITASCMKGESVDLVIHNAQIHTMVDNSEIQNAIAIKDGKIVEVGPERQILNKYSAEEYIDAGLKDIYPGFVDAHAHILSYAKQQLSVNLVGCRSYSEMIVRIEKFKSKNNPKFIIGRGWDQSMWKDSKMPTNKRLSETFPDIPVCLFRIDGHALMANETLIRESNVIDIFNADPELYQGGYLVHDEAGEFTGVLVDNAMNPILDLLPPFPKEEMSDAILQIQHELFSYGITGVHEAGMMFDELQLIESLVEEDKLKLNIYGMLLPTAENISFARKHLLYENKNLSIRSFKVFGDGALGSRGAYLKDAYSDHKDHHGYLTTSIKRMKEIALIAEEVGYQMNTHAIGDSTNRLLLELYKDTYSRKPDHRWRIEHAQIIDPTDFELFAAAGVFPSVQPTHAVSDQRWVESRVGSKRLKGAYAYKSLLNQFGMLAIGTDFPVELSDPFLTIHAAVQRKNSDNMPSHGFLPEESITIADCIKGMTVWAAFSSFQEDQLGTLEKGKDATLVIFENKVQSTPVYAPNFAFITLIKGKKVYSVE